MTTTDLEVNVMIWTVLAVALIAGVIIQCFFLRTLAGVLRQCDERNRAMSPGLVWLNLIPFFGTVWIFVTVHKLSASLKAEYTDRGYPADKTDFASGLGIAYPILYLLALVPVVGQLFSVGGLICWALYWRAMRGYAKTLSAGRVYVKYRRPAFG